DSIEEIWDVAQNFGLRPFATHFEVVPPQIMYEFGAYGMPGRFSHWTHGKIYQMQKTMYDYGLSKIYELVINTDPCWAFLLENNTLLHNKFVVAHVLGHSDFFANNAYYAQTSRKMIETMHLNAERLKRYEYEHGMQRVEDILDAAISIEEHVDPAAIVEMPTEKMSQPRVGPYDDLWIGDVSLEADAPVVAVPSIRGATCPTPCRDLLLFLAAESPTLEDWERDVLGIVRGEMLYFFPQMQTKIINEGWASYWHVQIMRELNLNTDDHVEFATLHSSVLQPTPGRLNPYYLGFTLLNDIERRWNELDGSGRERLFMVRETECDVSLIRNYMTEELCEELDLFYAERNDDELVITEKDWEAVRDKLVDQLSDYGIPVIRAEDADYNGNRELYLRHDFNGRPLDLTYAEKTIEGVERLWGRKVWLETTDADGASLRLSYSSKDGHVRDKSAS
ncbi:MAG: SpoVR family protein, partial [Thermomicrobiales bacterium]